MKKTILFSGLALFVLSSSFAQSSDGFQLDGVIHPNGYPVVKVILSYHDTLGRKVSDTASVVKGTFVFKGKLDESKRVVFSMVPDTSRVPPKKRFPVIIGFALENKFMKMALIDPANFIISGSSLHMEDRAFQQNIQLQTKGLSPAATASVIRQIKTSFIRDHPRSKLTLILMDELVSQAFVSGELGELWNNVDHSLQMGLTGRRISERLEQMVSVTIGSCAPSFLLPDQAGVEYPVGAIHGKYVLLHFWASWCIPCREENEYLVRARQQFDSAKIAFVGVSIDKSEYRENWIAAKQKDRLEWLQLVDLRGIEGESAKAFSVRGVPRNYLIDPNGIIVAMDLRGDQLKATLLKFIK